MKKTIIILFLLLFTNNIVFAQGIPVLCYHHINNNPDFLSVKPSTFEQQMQMLKRNGFTTISPELLVKYLNGEVVTLPAKPIVLTFDDGYDDNFTAAYPVLKRFNFSAIFFVIGDSINRPGHLSATMVKKLSDDGFIIGSHTMGHKDLRFLDGLQLEHEIIDSKNYIETITGKPVTTFAYPGGFYDFDSYQLIKDNYSMAFVLRDSLNEPATSNTSLVQRIPIFSYTSFDNLLRRIK